MKHVVTALVFIKIFHLILKLTFLAFDIVSLAFTHEMLFPVLLCEFFFAIMEGACNQRELTFRQKMIQYSLISTCLLEDFAIRSGTTINNLVIEHTSLKSSKLSCFQFLFACRAILDFESLQLTNTFFAKEIFALLACTRLICLKEADRAHKLFSIITFDNDCLLNLSHDVFLPLLSLIDQWLILIEGTLQVLSFISLWFFLTETFHFYKIILSNTLKIFSVFYKN
jgi:hypothetical protein